MPRQRADATCVVSGTGSGDEVFGAGDNLVERRIGNAGGRGARPDFRLQARARSRANCKQAQCLQQVQMLVAGELRIAGRSQHRDQPLKELRRAAEKALARCARWDTEITSSLAASDCSRAEGKRRAEMRWPISDTKLWSEGIPASANSETQSISESNSAKAAGSGFSLRRCLQGTRPNREAGQVGHRGGRLTGPPHQSHQGSGAFTQGLGGTEIFYPAYEICRRDSPRTQFRPVNYRDIRRGESWRVER